MRAAVALRDVVGEAERLFVIAIVPFQRDLDPDIVALAADRNRLGEERRLGAVEIFDERADAAFVEQFMLDALGVARIDQKDAHARIEEREFAIAMLQFLEIEFENLESGGAGQEGDAGTLLADGRGADHLQRCDRIAMSEAHIMLLAIAEDCQIEEFAERVDDRHADAVKAAGNLVGIVVGCILELTAGMKLGHDDLGRRHAFLGMDPGRNAAAIILDRDRSVGIECDDDLVAMAR